MFGQIKTKIVLKFVHHMFEIGIGSPWKYLIDSTRFFEMLKISSQEVLWIRRLLDIETLSSDGVKQIIRVLMYNNQVIKLSGHIRILVSFIAHPDVSYSHN